MVTQIPEPFLLDDIFSWTDWPQPQPSPDLNHLISNVIDWWSLRASSCITIQCYSQFWQQGNCALFWVDFNKSCLGPTREGHNTHSLTDPHTPELILSAVVKQTAGINLQTDLGDEDACIQNSFDVLQPAWAFQALQEVGHGGGTQLTHCNHNTAVSLAGNMEHTWSQDFIKLHVHFH